MIKIYNIIRNQNDIHISYMLTGELITPIDW